MFKYISYMKFVLQGYEITLVVSRRPLISEARVRSMPVHI